MAGGQQQDGALTHVVCGVISLLHSMHDGVPVARTGRDGTGRDGSGRDGTGGKAALRPTRLRINNNTQCDPRGIHNTST